MKNSKFKQMFGVYQFQKATAMISLHKLHTSYSTLYLEHTRSIDFLRSSLRLHMTCARYKKLQTQYFSRFEIPRLIQLYINRYSACTTFSPINAIILKFTRIMYSYVSEYTLMGI